MTGWALPWRLCEAVMLRAFALPAGTVPRACSARGLGLLLALAAAAWLLGCGQRRARRIATVVALGRAVATHPWARQSKGGFRVHPRAGNAELDALLAQTPSRSCWFLCRLVRVVSRNGALHVADPGVAFMSMLLVRMADTSLHEQRRRPRALLKRFRLFGPAE